MKIIVPDYYKEFKCIADRCAHTCCRGWEVETDDESMERYRLLPEIMTQIEQGEDNHFRLSEDETCPFLNKNGLCDIYSGYGESMLCQTCTDHPRFRNYWSDRIEMGLGLVCEEAARIILEKDKPMKLELLEETSDESCEDDINTATDSVADDYACTAAAAADDDDDDDYGDDDYGDDDYGDDDESWLLELRDRLISEISETGPLARLKEYLLYRHIADALYDDRLEERIRFVDYFMELAKEKWAKTEGKTTDLIEIVRQLSYDIEYDEEEKEKLLV